MTIQEFIYNYLESTVELTPHEADSVLKDYLLKTDLHNLDQVRRLHFLTNVFLSRNITTDYIKLINAKTAEIFS